MFPTAFVSFCLFHLTKSACDNLGKHGLRDLYKNPQVKALLKCLPALAALPPEETTDGFYQVQAALLVLLYDGIIDPYYDATLTGIQLTVWFNTA